jgi:hypothetical protein
MKKILLSILIATTSIISHSQVTNGLVAQYSFNAGDATDDIGSLDGTVNGASLTPDRFGNPNKAYNFHGGDNITLPDNSLLKATTMTVSLWVKIDSLGASNVGSNYIYNIVNSSTNAYFASFSMSLYANNGNYLSVTQNGPSESVLGFSTNLNTGGWQHFVLGIETDSIKMYIDGVKQWSQYKAFDPIFNSDPVAIGVSGNTTYTGYLNGNVDDIKVYNRMLTDAEVVQLYNDVDPTLSVNEFSENETMKIYPNPANEILNIKLENPTSISIVNIVGEEVYQGTVNANSTIDISGFSSGIYFIKDLNNGQVIKFIKK